MLHSDEGRDLPRGCDEGKNDFLSDNDHPSDLYCSLSSPQVIKPDNMVFLGHPLKDHQQTANAGEAIAERAIKCAEKPTIRFDYDYK